MKAFIGVVLVASLALVGCATTSQNPQLLAAQKASYERVRQAAIANDAGKIKDSAMLQIMYEEVSRHGFTNMMRATSKAITAAKAYEAGKLSKAKLEAAQREFQVAVVEQKQAGARARQRQQQYKRQQFNRNLNKVALGMQAFGNGFNARRPVTCSSYGVGIGRSVTCY